MIEYAITIDAVGNIYSIKDGDGKELLRHPNLLASKPEHECVIKNKGNKLVVKCHPIKKSDGETHKSLVALANQYLLIVDALTGKRKKKDKEH